MRGFSLADIQALAGEVDLVYYLRVALLFRTTDRLEVAAE